MKISVEVIGEELNFYLISTFIPKKNEIIIINSIEYRVSEVKLTYSSTIRCRNCSEYKFQEITLFVDRI